MVDPGAALINPGGGAGAVETLWPEMFALDIYGGPNFFSDMTGDAAIIFFGLPSTS